MNLPPIETRPKDKYRRLLVGFPPDLDARLRAYAAQEDRQLAYLVRKAVAFALDEWQGPRFCTCGGDCHTDVSPCSFDCVSHGRGSK